MYELMSILQFRTAVPFGYMIFFMILLVVSIAAVITILRLFSARKFKAPKLYIAMAILLLNSAYLYSNMVYDEYINFNPIFVKADVIGEWSDGKSVLSLLQDGKANINFTDEYKRRLGVENGNGFWVNRNDFNIELVNNKTDFMSNRIFKSLRVISFNGRYRLIIDDYVDPDMWDGHLGFKQGGVVKDEPLP